MQKKYLYLLLSAYAFSTFAQGILMPIYAFFVQKIGGGILETSWAIALYSLITGLGTIFIHHTSWSHTYRKECLWGGWFLWLCSVSVYFFMNNVYLLYISQILNGAGTALAEPVFDAEFSEKIKDDLTGGWALFEGTIDICAGVASIAGGLIAHYLGFPILLYVMFLTSALSFITILYYSHTIRS